MENPFRDNYLTVDDSFMVWFVPWHHQNLRWHHQTLWLWCHLKIVALLFFVFVTCLVLVWRFCNLCFKYTTIYILDLQISTGYVPAWCFACMRGTRIQLVVLMDAVIMPFLCLVFLVFFLSIKIGHLKMKFEIFSQIPIQNLQEFSQPFVFINETWMNRGTQFNKSRKFLKWKLFKTGTVVLLQSFLTAWNKLDKNSLLLYEYRIYRCVFINVFNSNLHSPRS